MTLLAILIVLVSAILLLSSSRRVAPLAFLIGTVYMTVGQRLEIGPFSFTVLRLLIAVGILRVILKGEQLTGGVRPLDSAVVVWGALGAFASILHNNPGQHLVTVLGVVYDSSGIYFLFRCFIRSFEDLKVVAKYLVILLSPVALEMVYEKLTGRNLFSMFGYVSDAVTVRDGKLRAQGPFAHAILAGTVGAVCMPFSVLLWYKWRRVAIVGLVVTSLMILSSASSGPVLTALSTGGVLVAWRWRKYRKYIPVCAIAAVILLELVMSDPFYFILARVDLTGSSTGWHRAALIKSAVDNISEWWLFGTDYTRHWMPSGVPWSPDHTDITNHYLKMGVYGGLPFMLAFIAQLWMAFRIVGKALAGPLDRTNKFGFWLLGAILFGHCATFISVTYFDQTIVFFYLLMAAIVSLGVTVTRLDSAPAEALSSVSPNPPGAQ